MVGHIHIHTVDTFTPWRSYRHHSSVATPAKPDQAQNLGPNPKPDTTRSNNNKSYINIYNNYLYIQVKNHKTFRLRTSYTECPGFLIYHIFTELSGEKAGRWLASVQTVVSTMMRKGNLNQS